MRRIPLQVKLAILFAPELAYEAVRESALLKINQYGHPWGFDRELGDYLKSLRTVISPASDGFDVGFFGLRVQAFLGEGEHAFADL